MEPKNLEEDSCYEKLKAFEFKRMFISLQCIQLQKGMSKKDLKHNVMAVPSRRVKREDENGRMVEVQLYKIVPIGRR